VPNELVECRRRCSALGGQLRRILAQNRRHRLGDGLALERASTGDHFEEQASQREDVGARVGRLSLGLLRGHVPDRAHDHAGVGPELGTRVAGGGLGGFRESEVQDLHLTVGADEHVFRFQVAMHDALVMRGGEAARDVAGELQRFLLRQCASRQSIAERLALKEFSHRERRPVDAAEVVDRENIRMRERRDGFRLPLESLQRLGIGRQVPRQDLDGDVAVEFRVARPVDLAHSSSAQGAEDLVRAEASAGWETHEGWRGLYVVSHAVTLVPSGVSPQWCDITPGLRDCVSTPPMMLEFATVDSIMVHSSKVRDTKKPDSIHALAGRVYGTDQPNQSRVFEAVIRQEKMSPMQRSPLTDTEQAEFWMRWKRGGRSACSLRRNGRTSRADSPRTCRVA